MDFLEVLSVRNYQLHFRSGKVNTRCMYADTDEHL